LLKKAHRKLYFIFPIHFSVLQTGMDVNLTEVKEIVAVDTATKSLDGLLATADKHIADWTNAVAYFLKFSKI